MEQKPAFWAVIPAAVRYDSGIPPSAKLLYAEISALTDMRGYCWATNSYFEQLYNLSERTIIRLIRVLETAGYIRVEDDGGGTTVRKIYAGVNPVSVPPDKNVSTPLTKMSPPPDKNVRGIENNINNQAKRTNKPAACASHDPEMFDRFWKAYPCKKDRQSAVAEWDRLKPDRKLMGVMSVALERQKASEQWQRGIGIPYACRWLKKRRWEDEDDEPEIPSGACTYSGEDGDVLRI